MDKKRLLKVKANLKRKQPAFIRQDAHKKSLGKKWRSPKGLHSKIGDNLRGYRKQLKAGYHTPVAVRGMDKHGLYPTVITNARDLAALDKDTHSIILSAKIGNRRRIELIELALKEGFTLVNATKEKAETIKNVFAKSHKERAEKEKARAHEQEKLAKKAEEKKDEPAAEDHADHEGHDHKGHDHADHDHASHEPAKAPKKKAPVKKSAAKKQEDDA